MTVRRLFFGLLLLLSACGADPVSGVIHLDPRLADGRSPAHVLAEGQVVLETGIGSDWTPLNAELRETDGGSAWDVLATGAGGAAGARGLELRRPIAAARWDAFEVVGRTGAAATVRFTWASGGRQFGIANSTELTLEPATTRFELSAHAGWTGTVRDVRVLFVLDGGATVELTALRFVAGGFRPGSEPIGEELAGADVSGDGGLFALGYDARRVWPADEDLPLFATAAVPRGGVLSVCVAPGEPLTGTDTRVTWRVDGRAQDGEWVRLGERTDRPAANRGAETWSTWYVPLARFEGREVELRLSGSIEGGPARGDRPPSARLLWGAPEILGKLPRDRRPNIVVVTIDTTRADAVGEAGWTPVLDALAARGLSFESAWSAAESTTPSHASILTGLMVQEHGALGNRFVLPPENRTLAELLRDAGYHTAAAVSAFNLQAGNGFGQGFDQFHRARRQALTDGRYAVEGLSRMIAEWQGGPQRPLFLWMHVFDPHTPYGAPPEFRRKFLAERGIEPPSVRVDPATVPVFDQYAGGFSWLEGTTSLESVRFSYHLGVAYADFLVGRLLDELDAAGELEHTAIVVTSDHGEGFGEREIWFNHVGLFREVLHVPLILALPAGSDLGGAAGRRIQSAVSTTDIAPTLLQIAAVEPPRSMRGRSLFASAAGEDAVRRIWFQHSGLYQAGFRDDRIHFVDTLADGVRYVRGSAPDEDGQRVPDWAAIGAGSRFLYDVASDPLELENRAAAEEAEAAELAGAVGEWMEILGRADARRADLSAEDEQLLRALGYAGYDER